MFDEFFSLEDEEKIQFITEGNINYLLDKNNIEQYDLKDHIVEKKWIEFLDNIKDEINRLEEKFDINLLEN